ncbi:MAG: hypothetical protein HYS87_01070 [Candidatus Colwellbacteria bacterium]|nr:hypothetical protein [Candidatus Colwellbacteria bacterium]
MKDYYFLCTPLYSWNGSKLVWDEEMHKGWESVVKKLESSGLKIVVAFRDLPQKKSGAWLREKEFQLIKDAKGVIVLMGNTPGIYAESGYANGIGKPLYGVRTPRLLDFGQKVQDWIESIYTKVFEDPEELIAFLKK